jgi:hypothetical protein
VHYLRQPFQPLAKSQSIATDLLAPVSARRVVFMEVRPHHSAISREAIERAKPSVV